MPRLSNEDKQFTSNIDGKSEANKICIDFLNTWVMFGETVPALGLGISPLGPRILPKPATWKVNRNNSAWQSFKGEPMLKVSMNMAEHVTNIYRILEI